MKSISRRQFLAVVGAAAAVSALSACGSSSSAASTVASTATSAASGAASASGDTIKVGLLAPLTGDVSVYGIAVANGANLYIKQLNEKGGINGKQIEVVEMDEQGDATQAVTCFTQMVDEGITFGDLKGTLDYFAKAMFGPDRKTRYRPHFFPFTEPSCEVDVSCGVCGGKGCRFCKNTGWLEILGAGMVDPNVFEFCGIDPEKYTGFAFGIGVERVAALRYDLPDLRMLMTGDMRFLRQF